MIRKLTFQLTPLLDLLLIVIFAQFMDVRETAARNEADYRREAEVRLDRLRNERNDLAAQQQRAERRLDELDAAHSELRQRARKRQLDLAAALRRSVM